MGRRLCPYIRWSVHPPNYYYFVSSQVEFVVEDKDFKGHFDEESVKKMAHGKFQASSERFVCWLYLSAKFMAGYTTASVGCGWIGTAY